MLRGGMTMPPASPQLSPGRAFRHIEGQWLELEESVRCKFAKSSSLHWLGGHRAKECTDLSCLRFRLFRSCWDPLLRGDRCTRRGGDRSTWGACTCVGLPRFSSNFSHKRIREPIRRDDPL
mmetsp:Transcript_31391/g.65039  ORF Transcript_31391/g.65039 Transcript_31391/m.65039 type:complete len:121 (+) Transcript_31391:56-418(+)